MKDKGKVTVFLCLIVSAMVLLGVTAVKVVSIYCAKGKVAMASRTAVSDIKANYDSYIFEHYHILLFDKTEYGSGEAAIEERMEELLADNLGDGYTVSGVELTDFTMIYDDDCAALKAQIKEQMGYSAVFYGINKLEEKLGGSQGSYSDELEEDINQVENMEDTVEKKTEDSDDGEENGGDDKEDSESEDLESVDKVSDPRKYTSKTSKKGMLLSTLLPSGEDVSTEVKLPTDIPSVLNSAVAAFFNINTDFDSYSDLKKDMKKGNSWGDALSEKGELLLYAADVFNCFTKKDVNSGTVLECELEYIIAGKKSDYENLESICRKIIAIRLPMDMAYLVTDTGKMATIKTLSVPIAAVTPFITEPVIRYLIAAGWSYVEAMAETRNLLAGNKIDFVKKSDGWITDLKNIGESIEGSQNSKSGLDYKDYLMLLMAMEGDSVYYRMLDVMDVNARQENENFRMSNGAIGLEADFSVSYLNQDISVHQSTSF